MRKTTDYLRHAEECRVLARASSKEAERKQLLAMAETWETLAAERKELIRHHPELFDSSGEPTGN